MTAYGHVTFLFLYANCTSIQRGRDNEKKLNDNYMRKKHGQVVAFGDIIQVCQLDLLFI
jgi:hypothetical protein